MATNVLNLNKFLDYASKELGGENTRGLLEDFLRTYGSVERTPSGIEVIHNPAPLIERFRKEILNQEVPET